MFMVRKCILTGPEVENENMELPLFNLVAVTCATGNSSATNVIREGGFGPVYMVNQLWSSTFN